VEFSISSIISIRKERGLQQKQVAQSNYNKIEKGKTDPSVSTLERIAKALGITLAELFQSDDIFKDINSADKTIMEKLRLIEQLDEKEKNSVYNIIDGLFAKKRLRDSLSSVLDITA
jgi:transcriptional regulator with XRE-family HTH domain